MTKNENIEQGGMQPDIGEVVADLSTQVAVMTRDMAIARSIISQLNKKIAELETK